jgi:predicted NBD/HSP70 family sugar kinase
VSRRTLEEMASGLGLVAHYNQRRPVQAETGQAILAAAATGDPVAVDVVRCGGEALGASVGLLVSVLDPEAVVVGGGLGLSEGLFWESFVASTRRHIWSDVHRELPVVRAQTGRDAGLIGAALAAWQKRHPLPPR